MTGVEIDPSLSLDTPLPPQNNPVADVGVIEQAEGTPSVDPAVDAPSAAGELESVSYPSLRDDGRPRTQIIVRPRWALPDEEVEGAAPAANDQPVSDPAPASIPERPTDFERERLNWVHSYYRGTVAGAIEQYVLYGLSHLADDEEETPRRRAEIAFYRPLYQNVVRDLQRADQLARIERALTASASTRLHATALSDGHGWEQSYDAVELAEGIFPTVADSQSSFFSSTDLLREGQARTKVHRAEVEAIASSQTIGRSRDRRVAVWAELAQPDLARQAGVVLSDASPDPKIIAGQRYAQLADPANRAITGNKRIDSTTELLLSALEETFKELGPGSGTIFGIRAHYAFAQKVKNLNLPGIGEKGVEASFDFGEFVNYGLENSIRVDIVLLDRFNHPIAVYDLKTGNAKLRPARVRELAEAADVPINRVIELRYRQLTAEQRW